MERIEFTFEIINMPIGYKRTGRNMAIHISNSIDDSISRQYVKMLGEVLVDMLGGSSYVMRNHSGAVRYDLKNATPSDFSRAMDFLLSETV